MAIQIGYIKNRMGSAPLRASGKEAALNIFKALEKTQLGKKARFEHIMDKGNRIKALKKVLTEKSVDPHLIDQLGKLDTISNRNVATEVFKQLRPHIKSYSEGRFLKGIQNAFTPEKVSETAEVNLNKKYTIASP